MAGSGQSERTACAGVSERMFVIRARTAIRTRLRMLRPLRAGTLRSSGSSRRPVGTVRTTRQGRPGCAPGPRVDAAASPLGRRHRRLPCARPRASTPCLLGLAASGSSSPGLVGGLRLDRGRSRGFGRPPRARSSAAASSAPPHRRELLLGRQLAALGHDERLDVHAYVLEDLDRDLVAADSLDRLVQRRSCGGRRGPCGRARARRRCPSA